MEKEKNPVEKKEVKVEEKPQTKKEKAPVYMKVDSQFPLNLRAKGNLDAAVIKVLRDGAVVQVLTIGKEWNKVRCQNVEGYVMNKYLTEK